MKTHQVIAGSNGERIVTSTTETLRIPASEIRPGDWLLKPHRRGMEKAALVSWVDERAGLIFVGVQAKARCLELFRDSMVDVERTT